MEAMLGDPRNANNKLSFAYAAKVDESEQFPEEAIAWLYDNGLSREFVPEEFGGAFRSLPDLSELIRVLSRRDLTTSITFSTLFWSFLTWMAGTDEQKRWLANYIMHQKGAMCLAYSEKEHGSDLLAGDTAALQTASGFELTGEKWPINRATVGRLCYVIATNDHTAGARSLSLFMVKKDELFPGEFTNLPKVLTLGIRGSDISGIAFEKCRIGADSLLGNLGMGLEIGLKGFQITRALCAAFSLGAGDTALRTTMEFALNRRLYGKRVLDMPHAACVLTNAFLDMLICDCVTASCLRAFHLVPEQCSIWSAVTKYFVPVTIERMIQSISVVLSARSYMREEHEWGVFQKLRRDSTIISVFDGSTVVNLHNIALQLRTLARRQSKDSKESKKFKAIFALDDPLPPFEADKLSLVSFKGNSALDCIEVTLARLHTFDEADVGGCNLERIRSAGRLLAEEIRKHQAEYSQSRFEHGHLQSTAAFSAAEKYCALHAAAACLHAWVWRTEKSEPFFSSGSWLAPALERILGAYLGGSQKPREPELELISELVRRHRENRLFSRLAFSTAP